MSLKMGCSLQPGQDKSGDFLVGIFKIRSPSNLLEYWFIIYIMDSCYIIYVLPNKIIKVPTTTWSAYNDRQVVSLQCQTYLQAGSMNSLRCQKSIFNAILLQLYGGEYTILNQRAPLYGPFSSKVSFLTQQCHLLDGEKYKQALFALLQQCSRIHHC